jgi:4-hydroxy-2-oxoglutarate aldolase
MIYNFPVVTAGIDLDSDAIAALAQHPNIVGTKLSCGQIGTHSQLAYRRQAHECTGKLQRLTSTFPPAEFAVFAGRSDFFFTSLLCGSAGVIGALVNVLPKLHGRLLKLHQEGDFAGAMALQAKLGHADWAMQKLGGISGVKAVVSKNFGYGGERSGHIFFWQLGLIWSDESPTCGAR